MNIKIPLIAIVAGSVFATIPSIASAQSWGVYAQSGNPYYDRGYYNQGYNYDRSYDWDRDNGYYRHDDWRDRRERWERERARRYWMQRRWERDHRWHHDDDDDDRN